MINIKKIISVTIILLICISESTAAIKDSLFATVGNKAVTRSDIINEIKIILILNGEGFSEERKTQLEAAAVNSVIMRNIKKIEIEKYEKLTFSENDLYKELERLASNIDIDLNTLKNIFANNDIDFQNIVERIQIELLWNSLIFALYNDRLLINLEEIDEQLKSYQDKQEIEEYLISEIILKSIPKDQVNSKIKEIKNRIDIEGFEKVAMDLSISETAVRGGDLGWLNENIISEKFKNQIMETSIGSISEPIFIPEGILFFKIRDKRKIKKTLNINEAKDQLVNAEKSKILNMQSLSHYDFVKRTIAINYY